MVSITIRDVPEATRDELAARAARSGRSMQEYLRRLLTEVADRPDQAALLDRIAERKRLTGSRVSVEEILALRDSGRR